MAAFQIKVGKWMKSLESNIAWERRAEIKLNDGRYGVAREFIDARQFECLPGNEHLLKDLKACLTASLIDHAKEWAEKNLKRAVA